MGLGYTVIVQTSASELGLHDSPLGDGFELPVPRATEVWFRHFFFCALVEFTDGSRR
jgi:hypothetical protein